MCDLCQMVHCPPACPAYKGDLAGFGAVVGHCVLCDGAIREGERAFCREQELLCEACIGAAELDSILDIEGVSSGAELLTECLGWHPGVQ